MEAAAERVAVKCPCDRVLKLEELVSAQEKQLLEERVQLAVINTKLNWLIAVLSAVGAALLGTITSLLF